MERLICNRCGLEKTREHVGAAWLDRDGLTHRCVGRIHNVPPAEQIYCKGCGEPVDFRMPKGILMDLDGRPHTCTQARVILHRVSEAIDREERRTQTWRRIAVLSAVLLTLLGVVWWTGCENRRLAQCDSYDCFE